MSEQSHALITGPVKGTVTTAAGDEVDVTPPVLYFDSEEEARDVADAIGARHAERGHPDHDADQPFVHESARGV
jgi:hypothetical protein